MTITNVSFVTVSDVALNAFAGFSYLAAGPGATVVAATSSVLINGTGGSGAMRAIYTGTGTTTGDQDVTASVLVKNFNDAGVVLRGAAPGTDTCYVALIDTSQTNMVVLYRIVAGAATAIGSWNDGLTAGTHLIRGRATGGATQVTIQVQVNGGATHTVFDADPARLITGYPGIHGGTDENYTQILSLSIDNFTTPGAVRKTLSGLSGGMQSLSGGMNS